MVMQTSKTKVNTWWDIESPIFADSRRCNKITCC